MSLRLIDVTLASEDADAALGVLREHAATLVSRDPQAEGCTSLRAVLQTEGSESLLDALEERWGTTEGFRLVLLPVKATVPRPEEPEEEDEEEAGEEERPGVGRVSREELYAQIAGDVGVTRSYLLLVALSSIVAAVGVQRDSTVVLIGAMVIAPLLSPNVALAFGTTLADTELIRKGVVAGSAGILLALAVSAVWGAAFGVGAATAGAAEAGAMPGPRLGLGDLVLALAAGAAGVLSMTVGFSSALVGVMVAVALLPPFVTAGLFAGAGSWAPAGHAALLGTANIICINLAGVLTFLLEGIRPLSWWEADRARRATRLALVIWIATFLALLTVIWAARL